MTLLETVHAAVGRLGDRTHRLWHWSHDRLAEPCGRGECPICGTGVPRCRRCWDQ